MKRGEVLPVQRLGAAWDRVVAQARAAGVEGIDTSAILAPLGRRLTKVPPPKPAYVVFHAAATGGHA